MKKDLAVALAAALLVAGVCYGLATLRPDYPPTPSHPYSTATGPRPASNERVVMRVNGEPISEREFNAFIEQAPEEMRAFYASPGGRESLANELVKLKALEQEGRRNGIDRDPAVVNRISLSRSNIIASYALRKLVPPPNEARVLREWEKERKNFESHDLQHILVAYQGSLIPSRTNPPPTPEEAMKKAQAIARRLRNGANFEKLAASESDDVQTGRNGGRLGPITPGSLPRDLDAVAMTLKKGEISEPVRSDYGVHIFKSGEQRTVELNGEIKQGLAAVIQRKDLEAYVSKLQKEAKVDLDPKFFGKTSQPKRTGS